MADKARFPTTAPTGTAADLSSSASESVIAMTEYARNAGDDARKAGEDAADAFTSRAEDASEAFTSRAEHTAAEAETAARETGSDEAVASASGAVRGLPVATRVVADEMSAILSRQMAWAVTSARTLRDCGSPTDWILAQQRAALDGLGIAVETQSRLAVLPLKILSGVTAR
ncbi:hypothetical protein [Prosthecomicrobium sp. N25]|uniref:hypothetical protein n=1 Tax=Prosthecomicrobium sp. N25 TaxID=3129254 RepID=UPI003076AE53